MPPFVNPIEKHVSAGYEEVEGQMACQEPGCVSFATEGKYFEKAKLLTWVCPNGHICKLENYQL